MEQRLQKVINNLKNNRMGAYLVDRKEDILPLLRTLMPAGCSVGVGGSVTLDEIGALELLRNGDYRFLDRYATGLTREQAVGVMREALSADVFLTSSNAITENGELYNVDGNANRVAALCFGPKKVIVIAGVNKLVPDLAAAVRRVKEIAAPKNAVRLNCNTPCAKTGKCVSLNKENSEMCDGCAVADRICADYLVSGRQRVADRIQVILCKENLGY